MPRPPLVSIQRVEGGQEAIGAAVALDNTVGSPLAGVGNTLEYGLARGRFAMQPNTWRGLARAYPTSRAREDRTIVRLATFLHDDLPRVGILARDNVLIRLP